MANLILTRNFIYNPNDLPDKDDCLVDARTSLLSSDNTMDVTEYLNYLAALKRIVNGSQRSTNAPLLDLGFLPVVVPPSFFKDKLHRMILPILESKKIRYFNRPTTSFMSFRYTGDYYDVWVHKSEAAKLIPNKQNRIHTITTQEFLEAILK